MTDQALTQVNEQTDAVDSLFTMDSDTSQKMYGNLMQNIDVKAEVRISRLQIVQTQSPELKLQGYKAGQVMDATGKAIRTRRLPQPWLEGKVDASEREKVECMPYILVGKLPNEATKWTPQEQRNLDPTLPRIQWKSLDFNEPRVREGVYKQWNGTWATDARPDTKKLPPPVTVAQNFFILPLTPEYDVDGAFRICSASRTSAPMGSWLATHITERGAMNQVPWFYVLWLYTASKPGKNNSTIYFMNSVIGTPLARTPNARRLHTLCMDMYKQLFLDPSGRDLQVSLLGAAEDAEDAEDHVQGDGSVAAQSTTASPTGDAGDVEF